MAACWWGARALWWLGVWVGGVLVGGAYPLVAGLVGGPPPPPPPPPPLRAVPELTGGLGCSMGP